MHSKHLKNDCSVDLQFLESILSSRPQNPCKYEYSKGIVAQDIYFVSNLQSCTVSKILDHMLQTINTELTESCSTLPLTCLSSKKVSDACSLSQFVEFNSSQETSTSEPLLIYNDISDRPKSGIKTVTAGSDIEFKDENSTTVINLPKINPDVHSSNNYSTPIREESDSFVSNLCRSLLKGVTFSPWVDDDEPTLASSTSTKQLFNPMDETIANTTTMVKCLHIQEDHPTKDNPLDCKNDCNPKCNSSSARYLKCSRKLIPYFEARDDRYQNDLMPLPFIDRNADELHRQPDVERCPTIHGDPLSTLDGVYGKEDLNCRSQDLLPYETWFDQQRSNQETYKETHHEDANLSTTQLSYCSSPVLFN